MKHCWDIKKGCQFTETNPAEAECPAYAGQVACWEFDWPGLFRAMPGGAEKTDWLKGMLDGCRNCEIHELHREAVDSFLEKLGTMYRLAA